MKKTTTTNKQTRLILNGKKVEFFKKNTLLYWCYEYKVILKVLVMRFTNVRRFTDGKANFLMNFLSIATLVVFSY